MKKGITMEKEYIIDYLNIAIELYDENKEDKLMPVWEGVVESYEDESYNKGLYLSLIQEAVIFSINKIEKDGHPYLETKKLHKKIRKAYHQFLDEYCLS